MKIKLDFKIFDIYSLFCLISLCDLKIYVMDVLNKETGHILLNVDFEPGCGMKVASLAHACMFPSQLLECYVLVMAQVCKEPICASIDDIEFFEVYEHDSENLIGGMYAIVKEGQYFCSFIGDNDVFVFTDASFKFVNSEYLYLPLKSEKDADYFLVCRYAKDSQQLEPCNLRKRVGGKEAILLTFTRSANIPDVVKRCYELIGE